MNGFDYQMFAMRTNDGKSTNRLSTKVAMQKILSNPPMDMGALLNGCLGLSGEVGEFNDMVKKFIFHEKEWDEEHAKKELGDVMWYVALICHSMRWNLDDILEMNIDKLKARYPEGFDTNLSNNRKEDDV